MNDTARPSASFGLSEAEAQARLLRDGPNRLPPSQHRGPVAALLSVCLQPMVLLLLACTALYALLGSVFDSIVLALSIVAVAAISVYQELRTQHVLEALRDLSSPRSTVVRDGAIRRISSQELVEGDRLIVQEGDRMACDARLLEAHSLRVDESSLTGESVPVDKTPGALGEEATILRAGSLVVQGDGVAVVTATGVRTALGHIGESLASLPTPDSRLHEELKRIVRGVAALALITCLLVAATFAWRNGSWTAGLLVGLTLAMSIVPEEFAVVWAVMLALGAWRLAQSKVLTRRPQAIEALGATTVLCVDKTGTLTRNRMEVAALHDGERGVTCSSGEGVPERFEPLLRTAALACTSEGLEPMDQAILRSLRGPYALPAGAFLVQRRGVLPGRPFVQHRWRVRDGESDAHDLVVIKGAPEAVLACCGGDAADIGRLSDQAEAWAAEGLRVIATARLRLPAGAVDPLHAGFQAAGLIAFHDPLREDVAPAIRQCREAGLCVVMITGDAPQTALAIARAAGLVRGGEESGREVMSGPQLDMMDEPDLERAVCRVAVFARVAPAQKLRIVRALQRRGEVVAMTGDGVNDGPALRAADVGVAMGERGTDVAREAAGIVLLDDRFPSLVEAVGAGRRIHANLRKAMGYVFAVHVPIVGMSLLPVLGGPVLLLPIHVVMLELIIDPACSLVLEAEALEDDGMRVPPRDPHTPLFAPRDIARSLGVGVIALVAAALAQWGARAAAWSDDTLRLTALASIVMANLFMLAWYRGASARRFSMTNRAFEGLLLAVCVLGVFVLQTPLSRAFSLPQPSESRWMAATLVLPAAWAVWHLLRSRRT